MRKPLKDYLYVINRQRDFVGKLPFSRDMINEAIKDIAKYYGTWEANKAIVKYNLRELGWKLFKRGN